MQHVCKASLCVQQKEVISGWISCSFRSAVEGRICVWCPLLSWRPSSDRGSFCPPVAEVPVCYRSSLLHIAYWIPVLLLWLWFCSAFVGRHRYLCGIPQAKLQYCEANVSFMPRERAGGVCSLRHQGKPTKVGQKVTFFKIVFSDSCFAMC